MKLLLVSGAIGFALGMFYVPTWHVAVETAQVTAGIVRYPPDNPFYLYHVRVWTILHQLLAPLLGVGIPEIALSKLLSGTIGMMSVQALSLFVYSFGRNAAFAVAVTLVVFFGRLAERGLAYPINLMGTSDTYGVAGLSAVVLAVSLVGAGFQRSGAVLIGLVPAIHAAWGVWLWVMAAVCLGGDRLRALARYLAAGALVTLASLLAHLASVPDPPPEDAGAVSRYLAAFAAEWDFARRPLDPVSYDALWIAGTLVLALLGRTVYRQRVPDGAALLLRFVVAGAAASAGLLAMTWVPPSQLPPFVLMLLPGRFLNFNLIVAVPLAAGLLALFLAARPKSVHIATAGLGVAAFVLMVRGTIPREIDFADRTNDPVFAAAAADSANMLLTGGSLHLVQLRTRRAVLLDGAALDLVAYVPDAGPPIARILRDAYGIDLFHPPTESKWRAAVPNEINRKTWERFSRDRWRTIGRTFGVTQVMTFADWSLDLPIAAQSPALRLYWIPE